MRSQLLSKPFNMFVAILAIASIIFTLNFLPSTAEAAIVPVSEIESGDLIRGESLPAVYYMGKDGFRYVFPQDSVYFSWYENFDNVKWISDADLGTIQIGGNVTYKPGSWLVKINTDPKTYAVDENATLRWVTSEEVATALYGADWNTKVKDVPDAFWSNYNFGSDIEDPSDYDVESVKMAIADINEEKGLQSPYIILITDNQYDKTTYTVEAGRAIKFVNNGSNKHTATADDLSWGSGTISPGGGHFSRYFDEPGTYDFFCSYHPDTMNATIIIE